ncbi:unnamed protein product [Tenebrio molitor]|nr:unnamed protein product [Tenebrio molitor]
MRIFLTIFLLLGIIFAQASSVQKCGEGEEIDRYVCVPYYMCVQSVSKDTNSRSLCDNVLDICCNVLSVIKSEITDSPVQENLPPELDV